MKYQTKYYANDEGILKQIGLHIKRCRLEMQITQQELANLSGISVFSVSSIEKGNNSSILTLVQIVRALNRMDLLDSLLNSNQNKTVEYTKLMEEPVLYKRTVKRKRKSCVNNSKINSYRLTNIEEPSDEMLSEIMNEIAADVKEKNRAAEREYFNQLKEDIQKDKQRLGF